MSSDDQTLEVVRLSDTELNDAVRIGQLDPAIPASLRWSGVILGARKDGNIIGVTGYSILPGGTAELECPKATGESDSRMVCQRLWEEARRKIDSADCQMVQCLIPTDADNVGDRSALLDSFGFTERAAVLSMAWMPGQIPVVESCLADPEELRFESIDPEDERLIELVRRTYVQSLDLPVLSGRKDVAQFVADYQTGARNSWYFVQHDGRDVGCLLLTDDGDDAVEITYMGLVSEARGAGWGREIVRFAQQVAATERGSLMLVLSVDEQNTPAVTCYKSAGFVVVERHLMRFAFI